MLLILTPLYSWGQDSLDTRCYSKQELIVIANSNLERLNCLKNYQLLDSLVSIKDTIISNKDTQIEELTTSFKYVDSTNVTLTEELYNCREDLRIVRRNNKLHLYGTILLMTILCLL